MEGYQSLNPDPIGRLRDECSFIGQAFGPEARAAYITENDMDPDWPMGHPHDDHIDTAEFEANMAALQEQGEAASGRLGPGFIPQTLTEPNPNLAASPPNPNMANTK